MHHCDNGNYNGGEGGALVMHLNHMKLIQVCRFYLELTVSPAVTGANTVLSPAPSEAKIEKRSHPPKNTNALMHV